MGLLFEQPSTRTRLGFQVAASSLRHHSIDLYESGRVRLGVAHGETLEDHVMTTAQYCDVMVVRSGEKERPAQIAALTHLPVINAGNGLGEHPTQALGDVFTIETKVGDIRDLEIALCCDTDARHALSFVKLLKVRPPKRLTFCNPADKEIGFEMQGAIHALKRAGCKVDRVHNIHETLRHDVLSMATQDIGKFLKRRIGDDEIPFVDEDADFTITAEKILSARSRTAIINPLPRHRETDTSCDSLPNAIYFEQVRLSTFMRMAILDRMLSGRKWSGSTSSSHASSSGWQPASPAISSSLLQSAK